MSDKIIQTWTITDIMNLSVKDVAELLNVSEKTIYRMIQNETIPCFRVGGQWRFDRREITSWLEDTRQFHVSTAVIDTSKEDEEFISIAEFLRRGGIHLNVPGSAKEAAVKESLERIKAELPYFDTKIVFSSIMAREALCSTAVGQGIALPHPQTFNIFTGPSFLVLCFLEKPIPFGALDNENVDTLFFIFPKSERRFLRIQAKLLRLLKDDEVLSALKKGSKMEIYDIFSRKEAEIFKEGGR
jgi:PTS system nitrogen regulatory IIA component